MRKYRIYALIHGQTLPLGKVKGCEIINMQVKEQERRGFAPIKYDFSEVEYETYATNIPFMDPLKLRTNYVIVSDIEEPNPKGALGGAMKRFDYVCGVLFLANTQDMKLMHGRYIGEPYLYQVNKIYQLGDDGEEIELDLNLKSGHVFLPNRPDRTIWQSEETDKLFKELLGFKDPVFRKASKYLYSSSVGVYRLESAEKIALDHFKSIELIVDCLSTKKDFKDRVDEAGQMLQLEVEEIEETKKCWDLRSQGDIAHSTHHDRSSVYPNQFPIPTGVEYPYAFLSKTAKVVLLKYFELRRRYFYVDIEEVRDPADHLTLGAENTHSECNHLFFQTSTKEKKAILRELRKKFSTDFKIDENDLEVEYFHSRARASVFIKNPLLSLQVEKLARRRIRISFP